MRILQGDAPPQLRAPAGGRFLYVLGDPRDGSTRWVGIATFPVLRLRRHCLPEARDWRLFPEKSGWVEALCAEGWQPVMVLLCVLPWPYILEVETKLIELMRSRGVSLFNRRVLRTAHAPQPMCEAQGAMNDA